MEKRVAIISPTSLLKKYSTNFHLVLTQYYLKDPKYRDFYLKRRDAGDFIILDNGAAELKEATDEQALSEAFSDLRPNVIVAPDVIYDYPETIRRTYEFLERYLDWCRQLNIQIMAVPQGVPNEAWLKCFETFNDEARIDWLGISKFYHPKFAGRLGALTLMRNIGVKKPCHLLGVWDNPYALRWEGRFDFVKSVDTAKPVEFGLEELTLARWAEHRHIDDDRYIKLNISKWPQRQQIRELIEWNIKRLISVFTRGV